MPPEVETRLSKVGWQSVPLGDVLTLQRGFDLPSYQRSPGVIPVVSSSGISGNHIESRVEAPGVVTGRYGTIGEVFFLEDDFWPLNTTLFVRDFKENDPRFIYYLLKSLDFNAFNDKSSVPGLNRNHLHEIPVSIPDNIAEQRAIAHILGTLDDKIDLNRRMNQTLEEMARALFHSWFVAFDPVRAKAAGHQPAGMDAATAALFPDSFVQTEHGEIPAGWRFVPIGDAVRAVGGSTPRTAQPEYWDGDIAFCTPKDLSAISSPVLLDTARHITDAGAATISSGILPIGTVLMSSRAPIGYLAITALETTVNQGMIALICEGPLPNDYVYLWARQNMDAIKGRANGTTFLEVSKRNFRPIPVLVPGQAMLASFSRLVAPMFRRVETNERESLSLAAIRDALLPKLLAGEMRLSESEGLVPVGSAMRETG